MEIEKFEIELTDFQKSKMNDLIIQRNAIESKISELLQFISDSHGKKLHPSGIWNVNMEGKLTIDIISNSK